MFRVNVTGSFLFDHSGLSWDHGMTLSAALVPIRSGSQVARLFPSLSCRLEMGVRINLLSGAVRRTNREHIIETKWLSKKFPNQHSFSCLYPLTGKTTVKQTKKNSSSGRICVWSRLVSFCSPKHFILQVIYRTRPLFKWSNLQASCCDFSLCSLASDGAEANWHSCPILLLLLLLLL